MADDGKVSSSAISLSKKALRHIQTGQADSLASLLNSKLKKRTKQDQIDWLLREGIKVIDNSIVPNDTSVLVSQSVNFSITGKKVVEVLSFPFQSKIYEDSVKYFHITISDNEIHSLLLNNYPPGMRLIVPGK